MSEIFDRLITSIINLPEVQSIGKTGSKDISFSDDNDVDIFIICNNTPNLKTREKLYNDINYDLKIKTHDFEGKYWGTLDLINIDKIEICLMYFNRSKVENEIDDILQGNRIKKEENYFYPMGRCATYKNINILYDKSMFLENMKLKLSDYPETLYDKNIDFHLSKLNDSEDMESAIHKKDILFYHSALDNSIDHYLQLLFTLNYCFFPSRKRSFLYINEFKYKPKNCIERLIEIVKYGGEVNTINKSYEKWKEIVKETIELINSNKNEQPAHNKR